jgi:ribosomal protein L35
MKKKMKIRKSILRRFKITKTGKILFRGSHIRHLRRKKNKGQIRAQKVPQQMRGAWAKKVKKLLGE